MKYHKVVQFFANYFIINKNNNFKQFNICINMIMFKTIEINKMFSYFVLFRSNYFMNVSPILNINKVDD